MNHIFNDYSRYYNLLYLDKDYVGEVDYIHRLIKKFAPPTQRVLELGCGTGKHANLLKQNGYDILGIDVSQTMLDEAKKLGVNCQLSDVRYFSCGQTFDTVLSLFHVASYQCTNTDVRDFFHTAGTHLPRGGSFIFDVWYKPAVLAQLPERRVKRWENAEIFIERFCTPTHLPAASIVEVNYEIVITDKKTQTAQTIFEQHRMRYFSDEELVAFANGAQIKIVHHEEWLTGKTPSPATWGVCFVGEKL